MNTGAVDLEEKSDSTDVVAASGIGFFEPDVVSTSVPSWVSWLLDAGLNLPPREKDHRRSILVVSTPCDAPVAGLVALGVVMRDLSRDAATDEFGHVAALRSWAMQYLTHCQTCRFKCTPRLAGCGFESEADGVVHAPPRAGKTRETSLRVHGFSGESLVLVDAKGCRDFYAANDIRQRNLHAAGSQRLFTPENKLGISGAAFSQLKQGWVPVHSNLQRSYSGTCFVGRRTGRDATRDLLKESGFILQGHSFPLSDMLTVSGWGADSVSRLRYASTRGGTCHYDRPGIDPETAIVDGATELVDALACPSLRGATMVAVVPRDSAQDKLELLTQALHELGDHYISGVPTFLSPAPRGISVSWRVRP